MLYNYPTIYRSVAIILSPIPMPLFITKIIHHGDKLLVLQHTNWSDYNYNTRMAIVILTFDQLEGIQLHVLISLTPLRRIFPPYQ